MTLILSVASPVFAVILAGLAAARLGLTSENDIGSLNRFVFRFAMPAALFGQTSEAPPLSAADLSPALAYGFAALAVMFTSYWTARRLLLVSPQEAGGHALASTFGNAVFLGLPIAVAIEGWAQPYVVLMLVEGTLVIAVGAAMMAPPAGKRVGLLKGAAGTILRPLRNPIIAAALAGFVWSIFSRTTGIELAKPITAFFDLLGRSAGPVALFSLGLFLATPRPSPERPRQLSLITMVVAKMAILPAVTLGALALIGTKDPAALGATALFTAVPTAIGAYVMATQYRVYVSEIAASIAISSAISLFTISAALIAFA